MTTRFGPPVIEIVRGDVVTVFAPALRTGQTKRDCVPRFVLNPGYGYQRLPLVSVSPAGAEESSVVTQAIPMFPAMFGFV